MKKRLRYTGEWPPVDVLLEYPNWEYALDEEGLPGQDETTLRPAPEQKVITPEIVFTTGDVRTANGNTLSAIFELSETKIDGINAFVDESKFWRIYQTMPTRKWVPYIEEWLPEAERSLSVSFNDKSVFPIVVRSRLPRSRRGEIWQLCIGSHGFAKEIESD